MNLRRSISREWEAARVTSMASGERITRRDNQLAGMDNYIYRKCTRLLVQRRELEGVGSESE